MQKMNVEEDAVVGDLLRWACRRSVRKCWLLFSDWKDVGYTGYRARLVVLDDVAADWWVWRERDNAREQRRARRRHAGMHQADERRVGDVVVGFKRRCPREVHAHGDRSRAGVMLIKMLSQIM